LTTAVFDLALAVPVLTVASGFQEPASAAGVNVAIEYQEAKPNVCVPYNRYSLTGLWVLVWQGLNLMVAGPVRIGAALRA
jgi:hypothetical protein